MVGQQGAEKRATSLEKMTPFSLYKKRVASTTPARFAIGSHAHELLQNRTKRKRKREQKRTVLSYHRAQRNDYENNTNSFVVQ